MTNPLIEFDNVGLAYRRSLNPFSEKNWVLKDLNLQLYPGEVLGIIGRNGAGKSTLLRLLADIIAPNKGKISRKKNVQAQLLTLSLGFINKLNGYDNVLLSLVTQGLSIKEAKKRIPKVIEFSELEHLMNHPVSTFSAGERARLGFAIALESTPDILLLDEMLGVGDASFRARSSLALKERVETDQTAVLVSHSPQTIIESCSRAIWIDRGIVRLEGSAQDVIAEYQSQPSKL